MQIPHLHTKKDMYTNTHTHTPDLFTQTEISVRFNSSCFTFHVVIEEDSAFQWLFIWMQMIIGWWTHTLIMLIWNSNDATCSFSLGIQTHTNIHRHIHTFGVLRIETLASIIFKKSQSLSQVVYCPECYHFCF